MHLCHKQCGAFAARGEAVFQGFSAFRPMLEAVRDGKVKPGDVIGVSGFGAGVSWGAAVIRWG